MDVDTTEGADVVCGLVCATHIAALTRECYSNHCDVWLAYNSNLACDAVSVT